MHNPESVLENEMHNLLWDFEIQTDHLISTRRPDQVIVNKKKQKKKTKKKRERTCRVLEFAVSADHKVKSKENRSTWTLFVTAIRIVIGALGTVTKGLVQGQEDLEIRGRVETIQTTALLRSARILRIPGDLRRLSVTQTPVKDH